MTLDNTTKTVSLISAVVAVMISIAGFFIDWRLKESDKQLREVKQAVDAADARSKRAIEQIEASANAALAEARAKAAAAETAAAVMKHSEREFELAARLQVSFALPLARAFAINFNANYQAFAMPTNALGEEFKSVLPGWQARRGLMTGNACSNVGLMARQIITLDVRNVGVTDAEKVVLHLLEKSTPHSSQTDAWQEFSPDSKPVQYSDVASDGNGWKHTYLPLRNLLGSKAADKKNGQITVVLASVSGASSFYGTVFIPIEISWTDEITKKPQTLQIMESERAMLRSGLTGAEIGSVGARCR